MLQIWPYICRTWDKWHSVERCSRTLLFAQRLFSSLAWGRGKENPQMLSLSSRFSPSPPNSSAFFLQVIYFLGHANNTNHKKMCAIMNIPFTRLVSLQQRNLSRVNRV